MCSILGNAGDITLCSVALGIPSLRPLIKRSDREGKANDNGNLA